MAQAGLTAQVALAETGARLAAVDEHLGFVVGEPAGSSWVRLDDVVSSGLVDRYAEEVVAQEGRRDVAGSYLGARLVGPLGLRTAGAVCLDRRAPDPALGNVRVRRNAEAGFDGLAFVRPAMAVLPGDPAAASGDPGVVVVDDLEALVDWWAERLVAAAAPLVDAIRDRLPFGRRCLWGGLADRIAFPALALARRRGGSGSRGADAWAESTTLIDALARHAPMRFARPKPFVVDWSGGQAWFSVKGTCCLRYRTAPEPDPHGADNCNSCPILDPCQRLTRWRGHLETRRAPDVPGAVSTVPCSCPDPSAHPSELTPGG
jgi:hypothetical protein